MKTLRSELGMDARKRHVNSSRCTNLNVSDKDRNDTTTVIEQIMLRYRPIAPKPVTEHTSNYTVPANEVKRKIVKRKYVRRVKKNIKKANLSMTTDNKNWLVMDYVTDPVQKVSNWISFDLSGNNKKGKEENSLNNNLFISKPSDKLLLDLHGVDLVTKVDRCMVKESWITVESVTGTCEDRRMVGYSDHEIWRNLESESCPGFVSNAYDEVVWVNSAYRRMVDPKNEGCATASDVAVWLVVKVEKSTMVSYLPAFTCRVRIEYGLSEKKRKTRMIVPCDVCKMDSGEFAWLLDVRFALSLGPLS